MRSRGGGGVRGWGALTLGASLITYTILGVPYIIIVECPVVHRLGFATACCRGPFRASDFHGL